MRIGFVTVGVLLLAIAVLGADEPPPVAAPQLSPTPPPRTLKLNLRDLLEVQQEQGHAEFNLGLRREIWRDPMVRLAYWISREQASQMRGGPMPPNANGFLMAFPTADPRLVLAGPFAHDWHELTTQEKIGRVSESVVYWGLIVGILSSLR
jgi:hypothetical protein